MTCSHRRTNVVHLINSLTPLFVSVSTALTQWLSQRRVPKVLVVDTKDWLFWMFTHHPHLQGKNLNLWLTTVHQRALFPLRKPSYELHFLLFSSKIEGVPQRHKEGSEDPRLPSGQRAWHPALVSAWAASARPPPTEWVLEGPHTSLVNWSTQALRIFSGVAGLFSWKSFFVLQSGFPARAARMASLMAKKMEAARKRGGSPTAWADRAQDRESGNRTPASAPAGLEMPGTPASPSGPRPARQEGCS